ncbi:hypothetical protein FKM82_000968 [Ascaphus truei]
MLFRSLMIWGVPSSCAKFRPHHMRLISRYQHTGACRTLGYTIHHQGPTQQEQLPTGFLRFHAKGGRSLLLLPCLSGCLQTRTIASAASLTAASVGQQSTGFGWYEGIADSAPVHLAESMLITLQETSGMPWWANIVCATITLRTAVTLPLSVYQLYILARVENLQPEIENLAKRLRYEVSVYGKQKGWSDKVAKFNFRKNLRRIISGLYVRDNCHPFKASLLIWIQIPMWIFVSISLRNFSLPATGPYAGISPPGS